MFTSGGPLGKVGKKGSLDIRNITKMMSSDLNYWLGE